MARKALLVVSGLVLLSMAAVGCKQDQVSQLPPPRFAPPTISQAQPVKPVPGPTAAAPLPNGIPRSWVPMVRSRPWHWIVIHHSDTPSGGAAKFDRDHREKGWDELGYHFVIGNGTESRDGQIEVGPRWPKQKWGAHTKTTDNRFNEFGIGICLVGDFQVQRPTQAQLRSLARLVAYLMSTYRISPDRVLGHGQCKPTLCPGKNLNIEVVRRMATQMLADSGGKIEVEPDVQEALGELMGPDSSN